MSLKVEIIAIVSLKIGKVHDLLVSLKQKNPLYKVIIIDKTRLKELPADKEINVIVRLIDDSKSMDCDRVPVEENEEEIETSSFMSEKLSQPLEETRLEQTLVCNVQGKCMDFG